MPKKVIRTPNAGPPLGAYSQGMRAGDFVFVTGCGPIDSETGKVRGETLEEQTDVVLDNVSAILEAADLAERDVPDYIEVDHSKMTARYLRQPALADVPFPVVMEPNLVVEFYSR